MCPVHDPILIFKNGTTKNHVWLDKLLGERNEPHTGLFNRDFA